MNEKNENPPKKASQESHSSHNSPDSHSSPETDRPVIPPRGDYQTLLSFQKAEVVYDITFRFAHRFLARGDRTIDQMIQSARSGKQNRLEGSKAGTTSKESSNRGKTRGFPRNRALQPGRDSGGRLTVSAARIHDWLGTAISAADGTVINSAIARNWGSSRVRTRGRFGESSPASASRLGV